MVVLVTSHSAAPWPPRTASGTRKVVGTLHFDTNGSTGSDEMRIVLTGTGLGLTASDFLL